MNKFCFGAINNGRLWEKELGVSALMSHVNTNLGLLELPKLSRFRQVRMYVEELQVFYL